MIRTGALVFAIGVRLVRKLDILGQRISLDIPELNLVQVASSDLDGARFPNDGDGPFVVLVVHASGPDQGSQGAALEFEVGDAAVLGFDVVVLGFDVRFALGHIAAPPDEQVDEMAGLREKGASLGVDSSPPRAVVIVPLVAVPQDVAFDHENLAQESTVHGVLGQADGHIVPVLLDHPELFARALCAIIHAPAVLHVERHRLFDHDMVPGFKGLYGHVCMKRVWCGNADDVEPAGIKHGIKAVMPLEVRIQFELRIQWTTVIVADRNKLRPPLCVQYGNVPLPDASASYYSEPLHGSINLRSF